MEPDQWLKERIRLFFDYCYPSIQNQSFKDFKWIVYFDSRTPLEYLKIISQNDVEGIIDIQFTDCWTKLNSEILNYLEKEKKECKYLVSTRIDCDDSISSKFLFLIQQKVKKKEISPPYAINCINGVILDSKSSLFYKKRMKSNPFITLIQDASKAELSIFKIEHQNISMNLKTLEIRNSKMWLQVIHESNLLNKVSGLPLINNQQTNFNIKWSHQNQTKIKTYISAYFKYFFSRYINLKIKMTRLFKMLS